MEKKNDRENTDLIIGRNAVSEALKSERAIDTLLVVRGEKHGSIGRIIAECKHRPENYRKDEHTPTKTSTLTERLCEF